MITQTWLRSQLTQICNNGQISILDLYFIKCESNLKLTCLNTFTRHIFIRWFNPLTQSHLMNLSNTNQSKLDCYSIIHSIILKQATLHIYPIQSTHIHPNEMINKRYTLVSSWSINLQASTQILASHQIYISNKSSTTWIWHLYVVALLDFTNSWLGIGIGLH